MRVSAAQPIASYVYLRVSPESWDHKKDRPERAAFTLRTGQTMLSVYRADMQTPRGVLRLCIEHQQGRLSSSDPETCRKAQAFLDHYGTTVEEFIQRQERWHVLRLPASAFTDLRFTIEDPNPDGHQNIVGAREEFKKNARALIEKSIDLTRDECLAL